MNSTIPNQHALNQYMTLGSQQTDTSMTYVNVAPIGKTPDLCEP